MSQPEKRGYERYLLTNRPAGKIVLQAGGSHYHIKGINNISTSGVSVFLDEAVRVPARVTLEFGTDHMRLETCGTAIWCAFRNGQDSQDLDQGCYVLGIELLSPLFFYTMLGFAAPLDTGAEIPSIPTNTA